MQNRVSNFFLCRVIIIILLINTCPLFFFSLATSTNRNTYASFRSDADTRRRGTSIRLSPFKFSFLRTLVFSCLPQISEFVYCPQSPPYDPVPSLPSVSPSYVSGSVTSYPRAPLKSEFFFSKHRFLNCTLSKHHSKSARKVRFCLLKDVETRVLKMSFSKRTLTSSRQLRSFPKNVYLKTCGFPPLE